MVKQPFERLKVSEIKEEDENYDWTLYVDKWGKLLGLEDQPIFVLFETKENAAKHNFQKTDSKANIGWNPTNNKWQIKYKYPQNKLTIIHELGHLYLAIQLNDINYLQHPLVEKNDFMRLFNILNDQIVNYRLSKFSEFYEILKERHLKYLNYHKIPTDKDVYHYLMLYFQFFLEFRGILIPILKNDEKKRAESLLRTLRGFLFRQYRNESRQFTHQDLQKLDGQLNKFKIVKDATNSKDLKLYIGNTLLRTKLWTKQEIRKEFSSLFPSKKEYYPIKD